MIKRYLLFIVTALSIATSRTPKSASAFFPSPLPPLLLPLLLPLPLP
jgi:hypothetical protein